MPQSVTKCQFVLYKLMLCGVQIINMNVQEENLIQINIIFPMKQIRRTISSNLN